LESELINSLGLVLFDYEIFLVLELEASGSD